MKDKKIKVLLFINFLSVLILVINCYYINNERLKLESMTNNINFDDYKKTIINKRNEAFNNNKVKSVKELVEYKNKLSDSYETLTEEHDLANQKVVVLTNQKKDTKNKYNELYRQKKEEEERKAMNNKFIVEGASTINQYSLGYPTGCESAALTLLLNFWGVNVNMSSIVNKLPKGDLPYYDNGTKYGGNPYLEFIGHPNNYNSYGTYDKVIEGVANEYKSGITNARGISLTDVLNIVKHNKPVIVWNSMGLSLPYISDSWIYKPTGEQINWLANEHAILVVGYADGKVIVSDSLTGTFRYFDRDVFESRYNFFGKRVLYYWE